MEAGGLVAGVSWTEFDFLLQGEEESEVMAQLLAGDEGGHQLELPPWWNQAASQGCYLSNSSDDDDALGIISSRGVALLSPPCDPGQLVLQEDHGAAAEFLSNNSLLLYGNYGSSSLEQVDLGDGSGTSGGVDSSACATNKRSRKNKQLLAEELDGQTRGRKRARDGKTKQQSGGDEDDAGIIPMVITSGSPTSCCCTTSDSDCSNASHQESADAEARPNAKKARAAGRAAATTEPQSIYARKRRERINQRLKILQNLVPNGTKVDISTMLEEAVQYVKFLQLQIKLLSSDDTWMYAPIAYYNGVNVGLDHLNMERC